MAVDNKTLALIEDMKNKRGFIYNQLIERGLKVDLDIIGLYGSSDIVLWLTKDDDNFGFIGISAYRDYTFTIFHIGELVGKIERGKKND